MAFNSRTYHANKYTREALAAIAEAKEIKARGGSPRLIQSTVKYARALADLAATYRRPVGQ